MVHVKKQKGESDDRLISRFRKQMLDSGKLMDYKDRERFKKKSTQRKEQKYTIKHKIELEKKRSN